MQTFTEEEWVSLVQRSLERTSRTLNGVYDRSSSPEKPDAPMPDGPELAEKTKQLTGEAASFLWRRRNEMWGTSREKKDTMFALVMQTACIVNHGVADVRPLLRTWETPFSFQVKPSNISFELEQFCERLAVSIDDMDPVVVAAEVERELNWRIHPFADGCGRISKLLAAFVLLRAGLAPPEYPEQTEYYAAVNYWLDRYREFCGTDCAS